MFKKLIALIFLFVFFCRPVAAADIEYALPYPGLLPDSPFYILKITRDRIVTWLIREPKQKAFYLLFLSDKRIAAGQTLINGGKKMLGVTTLAQGESYYRQAVELAATVKDTDQLAKLTVAGAKHEEVMAELLPKVSGQDSSSLERALVDGQKDRNKVLKLMSSDI